MVDRGGLESLLDRWIEIAGIGAADEKGEGAYRLCEQCIGTMKRIGDVVSRDADNRRC